MISTSVGRMVVARHATMAGSLRLAARTTTRVTKTPTLTAARAALLLRADGPASTAPPVRNFSTSRVFLAATKKTTATKKKSTTSTRGKKKAPAKKAKKPAASKKKKTAKRKTATRKRAAPKKRVLTVAQKEARREKVAKSKRLQRIRELREAALLSEEPRSGNITGWMAFLSDAKSKNQAMTFQEAAAQFKALTEADAEKWRNEAKKLEETKVSAFNSWLKTLSPTQVKEANQARSSLKRMGMRTRQPLHDSRLPKRARSPFTFFTMEKMKGRPTDTHVTQFMRTLGSEWKAMSAGQKKAYEDLAAEDKKRYERECKTAYGS